jgi:hypothetical protein
LTPHHFEQGASFCAHQLSLFATVELGVLLLLLLLLQTFQVSH